MITLPTSIFTSIRNIDVDTRQRLMSFFGLCLQLYRVTMSSLLLVFVPQACNHTTCSISERLSPVNNFNLFALFVNFITFFIFIAHFCIEYYREHVFIEYLDVDTQKPQTSLKSDIVRFPIISRKLFSVHYLYKNSAKIIIISTIVNYLVSALILVLYRLKDETTILILFTNLILILDKLANSNFISNASNLEELICYSAYIKQPLVCNTIDFNYVNPTVVVHQVR